MQELIKVNYSTEGKSAVSARELYNFLEIKKHFTQWFDDNRKELIEGSDYQANNLRVKAGPGYVVKIDFVLTLDAAKHLAMLSRVPKGKEARQYFIEAEKAFQASITNKIPQTLSEALRLAADAIDAKEKAEKLLSEATPKIEFYDAVTESEDVAEMGEVAKILNFKGIGRTKLFEILREAKVLMPNNIPYQKYQDLGWFRVIESSWSKPDGSQHVYFKTVAFQKGIEGIRKILKKLVEGK